jgi:integrase
MSDSETGLITSDGTRVMTVEDYDKFLQSIPSRMRPIFEICMITGMRYVEVQRLYDHPKWYYQNRNQIILPKEAQKKVKQTIPRRTIDKLPATFHYIFNAFISGKRPPEASSWNRDLERWSAKTGFTKKVGVKSSRKTIESWMLKAGIPEIEVYSRQGHYPVTSLKHYQSLSFTDYEMRDIKKRLGEWGIIC